MASIEEGPKMHEGSIYADRSAVLAMDWMGAADLLTAQNHTGQLSRVSYENPQGEGCLYSRALVTILQLCIIRQLKWHPTGASIEGIPQCEWDTASLSSSPHGYNISVLSGAAWAQAYLDRLDRGTCLLTSLKAWPYGEWRMPAVSTGTSTFTGFAYSWWFQLMITWFPANHVPLARRAGWTDAGMRRS